MGVRLVDVVVVDVGLVGVWCGSCVVGGGVWAAGGGQWVVGVRGKVAHV